jgi:positive regulator of sigma E activity
MSQSGWVESLHNDTARVVTKRSAACQGCASKSSTCACSAMAGPGRFVVEADNPVGARVGDVVELAVLPKMLVVASAVVFGLPLALLIVGAVAGHVLHRALSLSRFLSADGAAGLGAGVGLLVGVFSTWLLSRWLKRTGKINIRITRILTRFRPPNSKTSPNQV